MRVGGEGEWAPKPPARREGWEGVEGLRIRRKRPGEALPFSLAPGLRPLRAPERGALGAKARVWRGV